MSESREIEPAFDRIDWDTRLPRRKVLEGIAALAIMGLGAVALGPSLSKLVRAKEKSDPSEAPLNVPIEKWNLREAWQTASDNFTVKEDPWWGDYWDLNNEGDCIQFSFWFFYEFVPKERFNGMSIRVVGVKDLISEEKDIPFIEFGHRGLILYDKQEEEFYAVDQGYWGGVLGPFASRDEAVIGVVEACNGKISQTAWSSRPLQLRITQVTGKSLPQTAPTKKWCFDENSLMDFKKETFETDVPLYP